MRDLNQSAFPYLFKDEEYGNFETGMTLRDYFAAATLQTMYHPANVPEMSAQKAYKMADAMLKARAALEEKSDD